MGFVQRSATNFGFNITFLSAFDGAKNVYLAAYGATANSGFIQKGTWTVSFGPPTVVSVSPSSGSGATQTFSAVYSDPNGLSDLVTARILFNTSVNGINACYAQYNVAQNALYLENNTNNGLIGPLTPGSSSTISNSQCTLNGSGTTVTKSGNNLTVNWDITFTGSFIGTAEKTYLAAYSASANSGFIQEGTWTP